MADVIVAGAEGADEGGVDVPVDIGAVLAKYEGALTSAAPAPETPAAPAAAPAATPPAPAAPAATPPAPEEPPLRARQLAALARLEEEARASKAQYEAKLAELEKGPAKPAAPSSLDEFRELLEIDPKAAIASLGISDTSPIATRLMYESLGEEAPAELKATMAQRRMEAELASIKRKVEQGTKAAADVQQQAAYAARIEATDREIESFSTSVPTEMRFLASEARENAAEVRQAICEVAAAHIRAGKFPSARECAQAVEDQLAAQHARLSKAVATAPPAPVLAPAPTPSPTRPMETLADADTRGRPGLGDEPTAEQMVDPNYWVERATAKARALGYLGR